MMGYFYVIVQITSSAHNSRFFWFGSDKPFVSVNVVFRSQFRSVVLAFLGSSNRSLVFLTRLSSLETEEKRNKNNKKRQSRQLLCALPSSFWVFCRFFGSFCHFVFFFFLLSMSFVPQNGGGGGRPRLGAVGKTATNVRRRQTPAWKRCLID